MLESTLGGEEGFSVNWKVLLVNGSYCVFVHITHKNIVEYSRGES